MREKERRTAAIKAAKEMENGSLEHLILNRLPENPILNGLFHNAMPGKGQPESDILLAAYNLMRCEQIRLTMEGKKRLLGYIADTTNNKPVVLNDDIAEAANREELQRDCEATVRLLQDVDPIFARFMADQRNKGRYELRKIAGHLWVSFNESYDLPCVWNIVSLLCLFHKREQPMEWARELMLLIDDHAEIVW